MTYTVVPTVYTNDTWTAGNQNVYLKANLAHVEAQGEGEETFWLSAGALWAQNGAKPDAWKIVDNGVLCASGIPFDETVDAYLNFLIGMAKRFDGNSCHVQFWWVTEAATSGTTMWHIAMNGLDDGDALGANPVASMASIADAWIANNYLHKSAWVEAGLNGSPTDDNIALEGQLGRDADHGSDNCNDTAVLIGVLFRWTTNVEMDD